MKSKTKSLTLTGPQCQASNHGQTLVEFALVVPILLLVVFGIMEFGRVFYTYSALTNGAQEAARYGIIHPTDKAGIQNQVISTTIGLKVAPSNVIVSCNPCRSTYPITVTVSYTFTTAIPLITLDLPLKARASMCIE